MSLQNIHIRWCTCNVLFICNLKSSRQISIVSSELYDMQINYKLKRQNNKDVEDLNSNKLYSEQYIYIF